MTLALKFGAAATAFVLLLAFAEWAAREWHLPPEAGRKLAHIVGGVMAACLPAILPFPAIVSLAGAFVPFMVITRRLGIFPLIHEAERSTHGEVYFPLGVMGAALLVPHAVEFAFGVLVMAVADASASLSGQRFGKRSYRIFAAGKTYVGSSVFLVTTMVLGILATQAVGELTGSSLWAVLGIALIATAEEAAASGGADNVILPISAAAMLRLVL
jgi:phytol kinase